jgi:hypothetical protein
MTSFRALVRRGLAKPPQYRRLPSGFELEWFATTLGDLANAPWLPTSEPEEKSSNGISSSDDDNSNVGWRIVTGGSPETYEELGHTTENGTSKAHIVMMKRK